MKLKTIAILCCCLLTSLVQANVNWEVQYPPQPDTFEIGDKITLFYRAQFTPQYVFVAPDLSNYLEGENVEFVGAEFDTITDSMGNYSIAANCHITAFDSAEGVILPIEAVFLDTLNNQPIQKVSGDSIRFSVRLIAVDTNQPFKEIVEILETEEDKLKSAEESNSKYWWIGLICILILGTALAFWHGFAELKGKAIFGGKQLTPAEKALLALDQMEHKKLYQANKIKQHYIELTDILRAYLNGGFNLQAWESTTEEIIELMYEQHFNDADVYPIHELLKTADLVKFATMTPPLNEHYRFTRDLRNFILSTDPDASLVEDEKSTDDSINQQEAAIEADHSEGGSDSL